MATPSCARCATRSMSAPACWTAFTSSVPAACVAALLMAASPALCASECLEAPEEGRLAPSGKGSGCWEGKTLQGEGWERLYPAGASLPKIVKAPAHFTNQGN